MLFFLKKYRLPIIIFLLILIPLFSLSSSIKGPHDLKWYDRVILWVTSPVQKTVTFSMNQMSYLADHYVMLMGTKKENDRVMQENAKLLETINHFREMEKENQRLRELLLFKQKFVPDGVSAEVIAHDATSEYQTLRINKGIAHGLKVRMPTLTSTGIVGQVIKTWSAYSDILLLSDQNHAIDVIVQRSRARGILKGNESLICELHYLARTDDVIVGDILISSSIEGIFPKGFLVGTVTKIEKETFGAGQRVLVTPAVRFSELEEVYVVTNLSSVHVPQVAEESQEKK